MAYDSRLAEVVICCMILSAMPDSPTPVSGYALALETSGDPGSVALGLGDEILGTRPLNTARRHGAELLPAIDALCKARNLAPGDIALVSVSRGPGSFTGLRIGVTVAKMIAMGSGASLVAVPTLEVIAQNAGEAFVPPDLVAVVLDARRGHVYGATFQRRGEGYNPVSEVEEWEPAEFLSRQDEGCAIMGEGTLVYRDAVEASGLQVLPESLHVPSAEVVYRLGRKLALRGGFTSAPELVPTYIRKPSAEEVWENRNRKK